MGHSALLVLTTFSKGEKAHVWKRAVHLLYTHRHSSKPLEPPLKKRRGYIPMKMIPERGREREREKGEREG